jgi:hypothetical protein
MSNNKQSSVEWFKNELEDYGTSERLKIDWKTFDELFEQAKAMHEVQVRMAFYDGQRYEGTKSSMEYYNETYGGNK